jgi:hypothetical protein
MMRAAFSTRQPSHSADFVSTQPERDVLETADAGTAGQFASGRSIASPTVLLRAFHREE